MEDFKLFLLEAAEPMSALGVKATCRLVGESETESVDRRRIETLRAASLRLYRADASAAELEQLGNDIFQTFFLESIRDLFLQAGAGHGGLRILIVFPRNSGTRLLDDIAWETLRHQGVYLAHESRTAIVRYIEQGRALPDVTVEPPLRVLLTTAEPTGTLSLDVDREIAVVRQAVWKMAGEGWKLAELRVLRGVSLEKFRKFYLEAQNKGKPCHIWHHCGHGQYDGERFRLLFQNDDGSRQPVGTAALNSFVGKSRALRLVLLNVCHGAAGPGLVTELAGLHVPMTLGFRSHIADQVAVKLVEDLYAALPHVPVEVALSQARARLSHDRDPLEWAKLIFFSRNLQARRLLAPKEVKGDEPPDDLLDSAAELSDVETEKRVTTQLGLMMAAVGGGLPPRAATTTSVGKVRGNARIKNEGGRTDTKIGEVEGDLDIKSKDSS